MHDEISSPADDAEPVRGPFKGASFPIVGMGASAGGLEAVTKLLQALPLDTGMAFVLVQHLSPTHDSALAAILSRATRMPVTESTTSRRSSGFRYGSWMKSGPRSKRTYAWRSVERLLL